MSHASQRNALAEEQIAGEEALVAVVAVDRAIRAVLHQVLELAVERLWPSSLFGV